MKLLESLKLRWIVWVWNHTPNCAEMSRLASLSLDRPTPLGLRVRMRLHHLICAWCRRYERQLQFLHRAAPQSHHGLELLVARGLSPDARRRLVQRMREADPERIIPTEPGE